MYKELFFWVALLASVYFMIASFSAIRQADKKLVLEKSQKRFLYLTSFLVPLVGFILTRNLQQRLS